MTDRGRGTGRARPGPHGRILSYYREFLSHPDDARKVAWRTRFDQELRFENLLEALDDGDRSFSVLDVGCGLGDLHRYMRATGRDGGYHGIDIVPEMIAGARKRHPEASFAVCDILNQDPGRYDLVVCSGGLTVRTPDHDGFVRAMLERMVALADKAVAVNLQSTRAFASNPLAARDPDLFHVDPLAIYGVCRELCRWTALREDMLASDLTIYMYTGHARSIEGWRRRADPPPTPFGLAWLLLERRLPRQALEVLEHAEPSAEHLNLQGVAWQQLGKVEQARALYARALEADPAYTPARLNLDHA